MTTTSQPTITADEMTIRVEDIARHRNGVGGAPFWVVTFRWADVDEEPRPMVGIVFEAPWHVAVLDREETRRGNIAFAQGNSWRGDSFAAVLRTAITAAHPDAFEED